MPRTKKEIKELVDQTVGFWQSLEKNTGAYTGDGRKLSGPSRAYYGATSQELRARAVQFVHHCLDNPVTG